MAAFLCSALMYIIARHGALQDCVAVVTHREVTLPAWLIATLLFITWAAIAAISSWRALYSGGSALLLTLLLMTTPPLLSSHMDLLRLLPLAGIAVFPFFIARNRMRVEGFDPPRKYIPTLDGWRCIAILIVLVDHVNQGQRAARHWYTRYVFQGQHGVEIFFVISGFLITTLLLDEHDQFGSINARAFYYRRVFRILPAAYSYLMITAVLACFGYLLMQSQPLIGSVLFVGNFLDAPQVLNHFWSLSVEEQFYLVVPAAIAFLQRKWLVVSAVFISAAVACWRWYLMASPYANPAQDFRLRFRTELRLDTLLCGVLLAIILRWKTAARWLRTALHPVVWILMLAWLAYDCRTPDGLTTVLRNLLITGLIAGTVLRPTALPGRLLELRTARWIGRISYSLYVWQNLFCFITSAPRGIFWFQRFPYNVPASFIAAITSYYLLERPILNWSRKQTPPEPRTSQVPKTVAAAAGTA